MAESQSATLCHLTVRAPEKSIDLAVPTDIPLAGLLPVLLGYCGEETAEAGADHGGWVLQRLGGPVLDEEANLAELDVHHGEILYLTPGSDILPEVHLDDLVDGIASTMRERPFGWSPAASKRLLIGLAVAILVSGLPVLASPLGLSGVVRALVAGACGLLLIAGGGSASRAVGDATAGTALGWMAIPYFALAGWLLPGGDIHGPFGAEALGARLLAASTVSAGAAVLSLAAVAAYPPLFLGTGVVSVAAAVSAALMLTFGMPPSHCAGVIAVLTVLFGAFVPSLAFRLAGLRIPALPSNADQLQEGIEPHANAVVASRSVVADGWMTAFYGATSAICAVCQVTLCLHPGVAQTLTCCALSLLLLLHARGIGNVWQRLSLTLAGALGAILLVITSSLGYGAAGRILLTAGLLALTAGLAIASWTVPGRRLVPYWGRAAEILHSLAAVSLFPLALWVLGVYGALRSMSS